MHWLCTYRPKGYTNGKMQFREEDGLRCVGVLINLDRVTNLALVVPHPDGEEVTIWDSKESEFSLGLEYRHVSRFAVPRSHFCSCSSD
jgi:hypothetical protein